LDFKRGNKPYALSLKDMSHLEYLPKLVAMGIDSFKIEGRMKRPEYVAAVVREARCALEGKKPNTELLRSVFSRSGFTDGYLKGNRIEEMFGYRNKEDTKDTAKILPTLSELYRKERQQIPVDMRFVAKKGNACQLTITSPETEITIEGEIPVEAVNRPLTKEFVKDCLFRCGGTP
jgi:putative protease